MSLCGLCLLQVPTTQSERPQPASGSPAASSTAPTDPAQDQADSTNTQGPAPCPTATPLSTQTPQAHTGPPSKTTSEPRAPAQAVQDQQTAGSLPLGCQSAYDRAMAYLTEARAILQDVTERQCRLTTALYRMTQDKAPVQGKRAVPAAADEAAAQVPQQSSTAEPDAPATAAQTTPRGAPPAPPPAVSASPVIAPRPARSPPANNTSISLGAFLPMPPTTEVGASIAQGNPTRVPTLTSVPTPNINTTDAADATGPSTTNTPTPTSPYEALKSHRISAESLVTDEPTNTTTNTNEGVSEQGLGTEVEAQAAGPDSAPVGPAAVAAAVPKLQLPRLSVSAELAPAEVQAPAAMVPGLQLARLPVPPALPRLALGGLGGIGGGDAPHPPARSRDRRRSGGRIPVPVGEEAGAAPPLAPRGVNKPPVPGLRLSEGGVTVVAEQCDHVSARDQQRS